MTDYFRKSIASSIVKFINVSPRIYRLAHTSGLSSGEFQYEANLPSHFICAFEYFSHG